MSKERNILILEAYAAELRLSVARIDRKQIELLSTKTFSANDPAEDKAPLTDTQILDELTAYISSQPQAGSDLICLLSGSSVSCQYFDMPPLKGAALRQAVMLKLGQQVHFNIQDAIVDIKPIRVGQSDNPNTLHVAATAILKESVQSVVDVADRLKLNVLSISAAPLALLTLARENLALSEEMQAVVHIGDRLTTLMVLKGKTPRVTSELSIGLADFTTAMMRPIISGDDVIQLDEQKAIALRDEIGIPAADYQIESLGITGGQVLPLLEPTLQKFVQQLTQWLTFATTQQAGRAMTHLHVVGPGAGMSGLPKALAKRIGVEVSQPRWLEGLAKLCDPCHKRDLDSLALAVGAVRGLKTLPNLIPPQVRKQRMLQRARRCTVLVGPIVVAAMVGLALLCNLLVEGYQPVYDMQQASLADIQSASRQIHHLQDIKTEIAGLQGQFDRYNNDTPFWLGLFKELSHLLPNELQVVEYKARRDAEGIMMTLEANIFALPQGRDVDEVVEQTLLTLERSPFFKRVRSLGSHRVKQDSEHPESGTLSVELRLAYPKFGRSA